MDKTKIEYQEVCYTPYVAEPLFSERDVNFSLCRDGEEPRPVRLSFVVFAEDKDSEWEDDAPIGECYATVLGENDDDIVEPVKIYNLGISASDFVTIVRSDTKSTVFRIFWPYGTVEIDKANRTDEGLEILKTDLGTGEHINCRLTPKDSDHSFNLTLQLPVFGFSIRDTDGNIVNDKLDIHEDDLAKYQYVFAGTEDDDRITIHSDADHITYKYVWNPEGFISVRNIADINVLIGKIPARGSLSQLLLGAEYIRGLMQFSSENPANENIEFLIKQKDQRWRIGVSSAVEEDCEDDTLLDPTELCKDVFAKLLNLPSDSNSNELISELMKMQDAGVFQWFWLNENDWAYDKLEEYINTLVDPEMEMMRRALIFNDFDNFMHRLRLASLDDRSAIQADALLARNAKRKTMRVKTLIQQHNSGEISLWSLEREERVRILYYWRNFHSSFE